MVIADYKTDSETSTDHIIRYAMMDLSDGSVTPVNIPKDSMDAATHTADGNRWIWFTDDGLTTYDPNSKQTDNHPCKFRGYKYKYLYLTNNAKKAMIFYANSKGERKKVDVYDLDSNSVMQSYSFAKNEFWFVSSADGSGDRLYFPSVDTDTGTVTLKVFDTSDGSTSSHTIHVNGKSKHLAVSSIAQCQPDSYLIQGDCYLIKADRDGNMDIVQNGDSFAFTYWDCANSYYPVYKQSGSKKLYTKSDDGSNSIDQINTNLAVLNVDNGKETGSLEYPFSDGWISGISDDGCILLGCSDKNEKGYMSLVDLNNGTRSDTKLNTGTWPRCMKFINSDRNILVSYYDKKDIDMLHIDIYKSNIPHSVIDDALYFAQNNLPIVIGGGVVLVMTIGGVVVVCVRRRKKRSGSKDDASGAAPKTKKQKRSRRKKKGPQEDASAAPVGVTVQQTASQAAAPVSQPTASPSASPTPAQQPASSAPQEAAPQQSAPQPPAVASTPQFCRHCGSPLTPGSKFCPKCGHPVE